MIGNHAYDLMMQLVEEAKSLKRIEEHYRHDAGTCPACKDLWEKMSREKEENIAELMKLIKNHI